ncbi:MAG: NAD-dependent epimerase [Bacteroidota bacterium]
MKILVTGAAGFIGFHLTKRLLSEGYQVVGMDNINDYYDINLKYARLEKLGFRRDNVSDNIEVVSETNPSGSFIKLKLEDGNGMADLFNKHNFTAVCNLGAQAGVRYSIENPLAYVNSNIIGFTNILEQSRLHSVGHLVYASSSSVYGLNSKMPFSPHDAVNHPVSFYAATKKSNELMAHAYSKLYNLPTTGLRFFTVYGAWGRPDMSPMLFADAIMNDRPIKVFNHGNMGRDFTYIDDIIEGVVKVIKSPSKPSSTWNSEVPDPASSCVPYRIYNIGSSSPVKLLDYIETMESALGKKAIKELLPMQPGDVLNTSSDMSDLENDFGYKPSMSLTEGLKIFADWYKEYYNFSHPF